MVFSVVVETEVDVEGEGVSVRAAVIEVDVVVNMMLGSIIVFLNLIVIITSIFTSTVCYFLIMYAVDMDQKYFRFLY